MKFTYNIMAFTRRSAVSAPQVRTGFQSTPRPASGSSLSLAFRAICKSRPRTARPGLQLLTRAAHSQALPHLKAAPADPIALSAEHAALVSVLPGLKDLTGPKLGLPGIAMLGQLMELDAMLTATGVPGYSLERLLQVLSHHGRIRELAANPATAEHALTGMAALVDALHESVQPGRDALALNGFVGWNNELDGAIKALRTACVTRFMLGELPVSRQSREDATVLAQDLVDKEFELACARSRFQHALARAGVDRTMGGLAGLKVDAALVGKLRERLGPNAKDLGLAMAGLLMRERALAASVGGQRMLSAVKAKLAPSIEDLALEFAEDAWDPQEVLDQATTRIKRGQELRYLQQRVQQLTAESGPADDHGGLTAHELGLLGLENADQRAVTQTILKLTDQGLSGASEAHSAITSIKSAMRSWHAGGEHERVPQGRHAAVNEGRRAVLEGSKNEDKAKALGLRLRNRAATDLRLINLGGARCLALAWNGRQIESAEAQAQQLASRPERLATMTGTGVILHRAKLTQEHSRNRSRVNDLQRARSDLMGEAGDAIRDAVRGAILENLGARPLHQFKPADHAEAVYATLQEWGVNVDALRPEIDHELTGTLDANDLSRWANEAALPDETGPDAQTAGLTAEASALLGCIDHLKLATRLKMYAGGRIELQSGSIPVDPSMLIGVNAKAAFSKFTGLEVSCSIEGYQLVFRNGLGGKAGAEVSADLFALRSAGLAVGATGMVEATASNVTGVALTFPYSAQNTSGRDALKNVLARLLKDQAITFDDLAAASSIALLHEDQFGIRGGAGAKTVFGSSSSVMGGEQGLHPGVAAGVRVMLQGSVLTTRLDEESNTRSLRKRETEHVRELAATASAGGRLGARTEGAQDDANTATANALDVGASIASSVKHKTKEVRGPDGLLRDGTERLEQASASGASALATMNALGGPAFVRLMQRLRDTDKASADAIEALIGNVQANERLSIASRLDPRIMKLANDKLSLARSLRERNAGAGTARQARDQAQAQEREVRQLLDDPANYIIARISLLPSTSRMETLTRMNLLFVVRNEYTEDAGEYVALEIKPDPALAAAVRDEVHGPLS